MVSIASSGRVVANWEITPVFSFRGYFRIEGHPTGTSPKGFGDSSRFPARLKLLRSALFDPSAKRQLRVEGPIPSNRVANPDSRS